MYDIVFISYSESNAEKNWQDLKQRFPNAKKASSLSDAKRKCFTKFFWVVFDNLNVCEDFDFSYEPDKWSQNAVHVFRNGDYYDGVCLIPKSNLPTEKEFEYRFFTQNKEVDIQASSPESFDIVFISYNEPNAEQNFENLKSRFPHAIRVDDVKGIHNAHIEAAKKVDTDMFWVVDADSIVVEEFNFDYQVPKWQQDTVHVWSSRNPVNGLTYGYGGVKLLPTSMTIHMDKRKTDMTTSISDKFKQKEEMSNITAFNTDAFSAWRSGFRECAKLASKTIDRQNDAETENRLSTWCNVGTNAKYGTDTIRGAIAGKKFGKVNKNNLKELANLNDFDWLWNKFNQNDN